MRSIGGRIRRVLARVHLAPTARGPSSTAKRATQAVGEDEERRCVVCGMICSSLKLASLFGLPRLRFEEIGLSRVSRIVIKLVNKGLTELEWGAEKSGKSANLRVNFGFADDGRLVTARGRPDDFHCVSITVGATGIRHVKGRSRSDFASTPVVCYYARTAVTSSPDFRDRKSVV